MNFLIKLLPNRKHGEDFFKGPYTVSQVNNNGTVKLTKATTNGAVTQTWNIRQIEPRTDWSPVARDLASTHCTLASIQPLKSAHRANPKFQSLFSTHGSPLYPYHGGECNTPWCYIRDSRTLTSPGLIPQGNHSRTFQSHRLNDWLLHMWVSTRYDLSTSSYSWS